MSFVGSLEVLRVHLVCPLLGGLRVYILLRVHLVCPLLGGLRVYIWCVLC